jgi:hypothetical protein
MIGKENWIWEIIQTRVELPNLVNFDCGPERNLSGIALTFPI